MKVRDAKDSLPMMPFYVSDWRGSTSRATLSPLARLAYLELLFASWAEGGSLPGDDRKLAALAGISTREWERVRGEVVAVLAVADDGSLYHPRVRFELERSMVLRDKHRKGAEAANARRSAEQSHGDRTAPAQRTLSDSHSARSATRTAHAQRTPPAPAPAPAPAPETEERTPASGDAGGLDVSLSSEPGTTTAPEPANGNGALTLPGYVPAQVLAEAAASEPARLVLDGWRERTGTKLRSAKVEAEVLARIRKRLREGFSVADLLACVEHALTDEWYSAKGYAKQPEVFWRDASRVNGILEKRAAPKPMPPPARGAGDQAAQAERLRAWAERVDAEEAAKAAGGSNAA